MLDAGADKVAVNSAAVKRPELLAELAEVFGAQCVVLAIDARGARIAERLGGVRERRPDADRARRRGVGRRGVERGAGEILLTSMDRDGTEDGYDLALTRAVADAVEVPVIASGGAGKPDHLVEACRREAPTRCSAPRSSTTASTASARRRNACATPGSRSASRCWWRPRCRQRPSSPRRGSAA